MHLMFTVYILYSKSFDRYYVGYTNDLERRISEHNRKKGKFTDAGIPWEVVHTELFQTRKEAMEREKNIKSKKSKSFILEILNNW
jgi:putative endonuclease